jgi:hypothetical protein
MSKNSISGFFKIGTCLRLKKQQDENRPPEYEKQLVSQLQITTYNKSVKSGLFIVQIVV